jgi:hypothetical protein
LFPTGGMDGLSHSVRSEVVGAPSVHEAISAGGRRTFGKRREV